MYDENVFKILMIITLFVALTLYHITNWLTPDYWTTRNDVFALLKLAQFSLITIVALIAAYSSRFAQFLFRKLKRSGYIGGCYSGTSGDTGKQEATCTEVFTIKQSFFDISILGKTYAIKERLEWANWSGRAFKKEGNRVYFGITSMLPHNPGGRPKTEHLIMEIQFDDMQHVTGSIYSNSPTEDSRYAYWLDAACRDRQTERCFATHRPSYIKQP